MVSRVFRWSPARALSSDSLFLSDDFRFLLGMGRAQQYHWLKKSNTTNKKSQKVSQKPDIGEEVEESTEDSGDEQQPSPKKVRWETGQSENETTEKETAASEETENAIQLTNDKVELSELKGFT